MAAFNVVRFRVKPEGEARFLDEHRRMRENLAGMKHAVLIKTGERAYCLVGEWERFEDIVAARPKMIGMLDRVRDTLEDLGGNLGVTDPVSGEVVVEMALHG
jgi:hypothetical protein